MIGHLKNGACIGQVVLGVKRVSLSLSLMVAGVLLAAVLLVLGGCTGGGAPFVRPPGQHEARQVILATTTSTQDTGLLDVLVPEFEKKTGYRVKVIAVGSGAAMEMGKRGEADVLLLHAPPAEKELVESGVGINCRLVMHNDFVVLGPPHDPAGIAGKDVIEAFRSIAQKRATFVSRGDESGTHKKEKELWSLAGIVPQGNWYHQSGTGMGQTINITHEKQGYTLSDKGTYLAHKRSVNLVVLLEKDKRLLNVYHVMQVNPEKFDKVNGEGAKAFVEFMVSPEAQALIGKYGADRYGEPLFTPDAGKNEDDLGQ